VSTNLLVRTRTHHPLATGNVARRSTLRDHGAVEFNASRPSSERPVGEIAVVLTERR